MACNDSVCWMTPQPKRSYLVQLSNDLGEKMDIVVQSPCSHGMQEFVDGLRLSIRNPRVINIDTQKAAHIPILESDRAS
jgi:hypothetical protein